MSDLTVPTEQLRPRETAPVGGKIGTVNLGGVLAAQPKWGDISQSLAQFTAQLAQASDDAMAAGAYNEMQKKLGELNRDYANKPGRGSKEELQEQQAAANKIINDFRSTLNQLGPMSRTKFTEEANKYIGRYVDSTLNYAAKKADDLAKLNNAALVANASEDYTLAYSLDPNSKQAAESKAALTEAIDRHAAMFGLTRDDPEYENMMRKATSKVAAQAAFQALAEGSLGRGWNAYNHAVKNKMFTAEDRTRVLNRLTDEENRRAAKAAAAEAASNKEQEKFLMAMSTGNFNPAQLDVFRASVWPRAVEIAQAQYERDLEQYNKQLDAYKKSSLMLPGAKSEFSFKQKPTAPTKPTKASIELIVNSMVKQFVDNAKRQYNINGKLVGDLANQINDIPLEQRKTMDEDELLLAVLPDPSMLPTTKAQLKDALNEDGYNKFMEEMTFGAELTKIERDGITRQIDALPIDVKLTIATSEDVIFALREAGIDAPSHILMAEGARLVNEITKETATKLKSMSKAAEDMLTHQVIDKIVEKRFDNSRDGSNWLMLEYSPQVRAMLYDFIHTNEKLKKYQTDADRIEAFMLNGELMDEFGEKLLDLQNEIVDRIDR